MQKRKKGFYVPGIFTLVFLPIFLVTKTNYELNKRKEYVINYSILDKDELDYFHYKIPANRNYIKINIEGNDKKDSLNFLLIQNIARGLELSKDTVIGLKIIFNKKIKYSTFIATINQLLKAKTQTFIPYGDTLFVYFMHRVDKCKECNVPDDWSCIKLLNLTDGIFYTSEEYQKQIWLERRNMFLLYLHYWPFFFLLIVLTIISLKKIINDFRKAQN